MLDTSAEFSHWLSTYSALTAQSILKRFNFAVQLETLVSSVNDKQSVYFHLLRVPFKHVFNGLIAEQANDYRAYAQKLFIDYLLSGASSNGGENDNIDATIESERVTLIKIGDEYDKHIRQHEICIAMTQKALIDFANRYKQPVVLTEDQRCEVEQHMHPYLADSGKITQQLSEFRSQFYQLILRTQELLNLHPTYRMDETKQEKNRESLLFDASIGICTK